MTTVQNQADDLSLGGRQVLAKVRASLFDAAVPTVRVGPYTILERVGVGGMGTVFAAYDPNLDRRIAVKVLRRDRVHDARAEERFVREGRSLARLTHPNVVSVFGAGTSEHGPYLAMELVEGRDLGAWLNAESPTWQRIVSVFLDAARGLEAVHQADVVHRDFKPGNVLLANDGRVLVADFGLARMPSLEDTLSETSTPDEDDVTDGVVGTPLFMSPEQKRLGRVTPASDQYSFCVAMDRALAGVSGTPKRVIAAVRRGLSEDASARWPSMAALISELDKARHRRRRRWLGIAAIIGTSVGLAAWSGAAEVEPAPCDGAGGEAAALWNDGVRDELSAKPEATARLSAYATTWAEQRSMVCRDRVAGRASRPLSEARISCLDRTLGGFEDAVDLVRQAPTPDSAGRVLDAALEDPGRCLQPESSHFTTWRHPSPEAGMRGDRARRTVERLWAAHGGGLTDEAARLTKVLETDLDELVDPSPRGMVARVLAHHSPEPERRASLFRQAQADGVRSRNDELLINASLDLADHEWKEGRPGAALDELAIAEAAIDRMETYADAHEALVAFTPKFRGRLHNLRGVARLSQGQYLLAAVEFEHALEHSPDHDRSRAALAENNAAEALRATGRYTEALHRYDRALVIVRETEGDKHPWVAAIRMNRGNTHLARGEIGAATEDIEAAQRLTRALEGARSRALAAAGLEAVPLYIARGDLEAARRKLAVAAEVLGPLLPSTDHYWIEASRLAGLVARARGNHDEAIEHGRVSVELATRLLGASHPKVASATVDLALSLLSAGRVPEDLDTELDAARARIEASIGESATEAGLLLTAEGELALHRGREADAQRKLRMAIDVLDAAADGEHPLAQRARDALATLQAD